jgi:ABC-type multidrug transport system fused ATPase/permease subunit
MKIPPILNSQRRIKFVWLVLNGFMQSAMTILFSILVKSVFDNFIYENKISPSILNVILFFLGIILVTGWLKYRERSDAEILGQDYVHELRNRMFSRLCRTDLRQLDHHGRGDIILRFASDLTAIRQWVSLGYARLLVAGIIIVFAISALSFINLTLATMIGIVMLITAFLSIYIGKKMENTFREARKSRSSLANNLTEKITSLITV